VSGGSACLVGLSAYLGAVFPFRIFPFGLPLSLSAFCFGGGGRWVSFALHGK